MTWILIAIALGLILGVLGYYFSVQAFDFFVTAIIIVMSFSIPVGSSFSQELAKPGGYYNIIELFAKQINRVPDYIQWAALLFAVSFFLARFVTWFLTKLNILPEIFNSKPNLTERAIEEYGYDKDDIIGHEFYH